MLLGMLVEVPSDMVLEVVAVAVQEVVLVVEVLVEEEVPSLVVEVE